MVPAGEGETKKETAKRLQTMESPTASYQRRLAPASHSASGRQQHDATLSPLLTDEDLHQQSSPLMMNPSFLSNGHHDHAEFTNGHHQRQSEVQTNGEDHRHHHHGSLGTAIALDHETVESSAADGEHPREISTQRTAALSSEPVTMIAANGYSGHSAAAGLPATPRTFNSYAFSADQLQLPELSDRNVLTAHPSSDAFCEK